MPKVRLLLTCLGGRYSLCMVQALRQSSDPRIEIVGADITDDVLGKSFVEAFRVVPRGSDERYVPELLRICREEGIECVIPCADEEVYAISRQFDLFEKEGIRCAVDRFQNIELINDKLLLYEKLKEHGLLAAGFMSVPQVSDVQSAAERFGYPREQFVIKPRTSRGSRGVYIIGEQGDATPLKEFLRHCEESQVSRLDSVAMEYLPGPAYDVDVIARDGDPVCVVPRLRVYKNKLSNFSEGHRFERNTALTHLAEEITRALKLRCGFDFDCGTSEGGVPTIYEVNSRLSGSCAAGIGAGVNVPLSLVHLVMGLEIPRFRIDYGVTMFPFHGMAYLDKDGKGFRLSEQL